MEEERGKKYGRLQKVESIAKIVGAVSIPIIGLIVSILLNFNAEKNRRVQLFAEIMSRRESADSDIRASMFNTLMQEYLGLSSDNQGKDNIADIGKKVVFLNLLISNFQEYFNAKPLFEDLYGRIKELNKEGLGENESKKLEVLGNDLIKMSKSTARKQEVMLSRIGVTKNVLLEKNKTKCVLLYNPAANGFKIEGENGELKVIDDYHDGKCININGDSTISDEKESLEISDEKESLEIDNDDKAYYAIQITIEEIKGYEVTTKMSLYQDYFKDKVKVLRLFVKDNIEFGVSYFDLPYMDNTLLFDGKRFALILHDIPYPNKDWVDLGLITFREEFMSLRDRPLFEDMLNKLHNSK